MKININTNVKASKPISFFYALLLACFFISGFTGLVYEILWTRQIVEIIGSAPFSVSIVLTVFMGGLGLGSHLVGKRIDIIKNPMRLVQIYGALELVIAAYGLLLPLLLTVCKPLFAILYNQFYEYFWFYNLTTFLGCSLLLIIPAICMGATLPVLCRFFITNINDVGKQIGKLYGLNTIGAACGSLVCGFWLISRFGIWGTLIIAVALNIFIGVTCLIVATKRVRSKHNEDTSSVLPDSSGSESNKPNYLNPTENRRTIFLALLIFAISGFAAMAYEVVWIKLIGLIIGPTTYSFTIVLVTFISCLALGSLFFGRIADKVNNRLYLLIATQIFAAISALIVSQLLGNSQFFFSNLILEVRDNFATMQIVQGLVLFLFMAAPTFCLGATFPLVGKICTQSLEKTGNTIGSAYAVNTIGAVLGSFTAGFILIPLLGKENSIRVVAGVQLFIPIIFSLSMIRIKTNKKKWIPLVTAICIGLICLTIYPSWDRKMLSRGKYQRPKAWNIQKMGWLDSLLNGTETMSKALNDKSELIYFGDGIGGFTTVLKSEQNFFGANTYSLYNSGKADASSDKEDMCTQVLLAHFPLIFHENPKDVLILGLASGITAGEVLHYPIEKLDTIEINQQVVEASDYFIPWNNNVLNDPKTNLIIQDGRAHLELTNQTYDVIISEPSNPWMAGLASLFTREFMTLAKERLNNNGIYVQWVHSYQMDWETFSLIGRTFSDVFPNSLIASTNPRKIGPDFILVGFRDDYNLNPKVAEKQLAFAGKSKNMTLLDSTIMFRHIMNENLSELFGEGSLNTDNSSLLEFSAPKLLHSFESAITISRIIKEKIWLKDSTKDIFKENHSNIKKQIDYIAYLLSFGISYPGIDKISGMSPIQKKELENHLIAYCRETKLSDFDFIHDQKIRKNCVRGLIDAVNPKGYADRAKLYYYLGYNCLKNNMNTEAMEYFLKTIKTNPQHSNAHFNVGYLSLQQQNYPLAESHLKEVLKIKPNNTQALTLLKQTRTELSKIDNYIESLKEKAGHTPNNHLIYHAIANMYQKKGNIDNAIENYSRTLAIQPDFFSALQNLAYIHATKNENDKSIMYFKKMVNLKPSVCPLYYNIACLYSKENQIENSIDWLEQAIKKGFNSWEEIETDSDFSNIRNTHAFNELKAKYKG